MFFFFFKVPGKRTR